jgi:hypothetical protein
MSNTNSTQIRHTQRLSVLQVAHQLSPPRRHHLGPQPLNSILVEPTRAPMSIPTMLHNLNLPHLAQMRTCSTMIKKLTLVTQDIASPGRTISSTVKNWIP